MKLLLDGVHKTQAGRPATFCLLLFVMFGKICLKLKQVCQSYKHVRIQQIKSLTCNASLTSRFSIFTKLTLSILNFNNCPPVNCLSNLMELKLIFPQFLKFTGMFVGLTPVRSSAIITSGQEVIKTLET